MDRTKGEISALAITDRSVVNFQNEMENFFFGTHLCEIHPYGMISTARYPEFHEALQNFEVFDDDVFVVTHPKAGKYGLERFFNLAPYHYHVSVTIAFPLLPKTSPANTTSNHF